MSLEIAVEPVSRRFNVKRDASAEESFQKALGVDLAATETG